MCKRLLVLAIFAGILLPDDGLSDARLSASAKLFGSMPTAWGVRLSPDGKKVSFLRQHSSDAPIAMVFNLETGEGNPILASEKGKLELTRCDWASNTRLLCGYYGIVRVQLEYYSATRLVAVNEDPVGVQPAA